MFELRNSVGSAKCMSTESILLPLNVAFNILRIILSWIHNRLVVNRTIENA